MTINFYTRPGCHLCEDARKVLNSMEKELSLPVQERNIDTSDEWTEKYGLMIPVVEIEGEVLAYGNIEPSVLFTKLKQIVNE